LAKVGNLNENMSMGGRQIHVLFLISDIILPSAACRVNWCVGLSEEAPVCRGLGCVSLERIC